MVTTRRMMESINKLESSDKDKLSYFIHKLSYFKLNYWLQSNNTMLLGDYLADSAHLLKPFITCLGREKAQVVMGLLL